MAASSGTASVSPGQSAAGSTISSAQPSSVAHGSVQLLCPSSDSAAMSVLAGSDLSCAP
jgi:hypothetical protein